MQMVSLYGKELISADCEVATFSIRATDLLGSPPGISPHSFLVVWSQNVGAPLQCNVLIADPRSFVSFDPDSTVDCAFNELG